MNPSISKYKFIWLVVAVLAVFLLAWGLSNVFSGSTILPQYFQFGFLRIHFYGLAIAGSLAAAYLWLSRSASRYGVLATELESLVVILIIVGFVGARLYHVVSELGFYSTQPIYIIYIWQGGLGIYGGVIGGLIALLFYARYHKWSFQKVLSLLDWLVPGVVIGQIIGRFGNLFNYEAFGYPTSLPWRMFVPEQFRPEELVQFSYFHPLFLYEALFNSLVLIVLLWLSRGKQLKPGSLFVAYVFLYNMGRFFIEGYRIDSVLIGTARLNSIVSLALVMLALILWYAIYYRKVSSRN